MYFAFTLDRIGYKKDRKFVQKGYIDQGSY